MLFTVAELTLVLFFFGAAIAALRTGVVPKWWAYFAILIGIVLLIGPIGWAALIFGTPIWVLDVGVPVAARAPAASARRDGSRLSA